METRFGSCVLDTTSRQLWREGESVPLSRKAYDLLELLVASRPRALGKSELLQSLWPATFVVEANLSNLVAEIRHATGDDAKKARYVRTVRGFGYAFSAVVTEGTAPAGRTEIECWVVWGERRVRLAEGDNPLGRHHGSVVPLDSRLVSRHHAVIRVSGRVVTIEDLGSRNGTYVGEDKIAFAAQLKDGDLIRVGSLTMKLRIALNAAIDATTDVDIPLPPGLRRPEP